MTKKKDPFEVNGKAPRVRGTQAFKLKDHPDLRRFVMIDCMKHFGFIPEKFIVAKMPNSSNAFTILAILTEAEEKREDELNKQRKLLAKKALKKVQKKETN